MHECMQVQPRSFCRDDCFSEDRQECCCGYIETVYIILGTLLKGLFEFSFPPFFVDLCEPGEIKEN